MNDNFFCVLYSFKAQASDVDKLADWNIKKVTEVSSSICSHTHNQTVN